MHEENGKTSQKFEWDGFLINWYKLLLCSPILMGLILGIVIPLYILKEETTNKSKEGMIGAVTGGAAGLVTGGTILGALGGICFFKNRQHLSQAESDDNQQLEGDTTTMTVNP
jgi:hypothetical protein